MAFDCLLCKRSFDTQRGLNVHTKRSHGADTVESPLSADSVVPVESIPLTTTTIPQEIVMWIMWMNPHSCGVTKHRANSHET